MFALKLPSLSIYIVWSFVVVPGPLCKSVLRIEVLYIFFKVRAFLNVK